jgi:hypothetical protein
VTDPCFGRWQRLRWENPQKGRYYEAWARKNLLGEWEVLCAWGGIGTKLGGSKVIPTGSLEAAADTMATIHTKRLKRHYLLVKPC